MRIQVGLILLVLSLCCGIGKSQEHSQISRAQIISIQPSPAQTMPLRVQVSGTLKDPMGRPRTGTLGITFTLYQEGEGGNPLWLETHNVQLDEQGRYTVMLGSEHAEGLPLELFTSGEARWLGVHALLPGEPEQPRIQLVSVPYALKAVDSDTLGGKPLSAFVLANAEAPGSSADSVGADSDSVKKSAALPKGTASPGDSGDVIMSNPYATQTITAPSEPGVIPLQIKGSPFNNSLEIYDSPSSLTPQSYFTSQGAFVTKNAPTFSSISPGSVLFAGANGLLSEERTNFFWDNIGKGLRVGPPISSFTDGTITYRFDASLSHFLAKDSGKDFVLQVGNQDGSTRHSTVQLVTQEDTHALGNRGSVVASSSQVFHSGAGSTSFLVASIPYIEHFGTGPVANLIAETPYISFGSYEPDSTAGAVKNLEVIKTGADISGVNNAEIVIGVHITSPSKSGTGTVSNNYGIKVEDQSIGSNNWAIQTGSGKVQFGDTVQADKSFYAGQVIVSFSATPILDASIANSFKMSLSADITASTIANGNIGQIIVLLLCQEAGGNHSMAWPSNVRLSNGRFNLTKIPGKCDSWTGVYDGQYWHETSRSSNM